MKSFNQITKVLSMASLFIGSAMAGDVHWGYDGDAGPENWAKLDAKFSACNGVNQSPINLKGFVEAELPPISFDYAKQGTEILNNGHTIKVSEAKGSKMNVEGVDYSLLQFHFHAPSENWLMDKSYPMEVHLVHADKAGNLAVIGVLFEEGAENKFLKNFWEKMPHKSGEKSELKDLSSTLQLLPEKKDYYRFNGSLTTPPCSEGVKWFVMKDVLTASKEQIKAFEKVMHHHNNRPVQPTNARLILQ